MTDVTFDSLGLPPDILKALHETGYTVPTPIQAQSIPALMHGNDLLGLAETGSGKTAAFALPLLSMLASNGAPRLPKSTRALILAPTRELAIQIGDSMREYGKHMGFKYAMIFGGVGISPQIRTMQMGVDVLVATPGRLLDLMHQRAVKLDNVSHFVLDEADRMLDMGFIHDVRKIVAALPKARQSLLFSATMPEDISSLAAKLLRNPVRVEVARAGTPVDRIDQKVYYVETPQKRAALAALLKDDKLDRVIVFTRTKRGADRVARGLESVGIGAHAIHGNKSQNARQGALSNFRDGHARVLVATDIAARGIDIDAISHVINYEVPNVPESYVHRIGRTARAGANGTAISLCAPDERGYMRDIERLMSRKVADAGDIPGLAEVAASLPAIKHRKDEDGQDDSHFDRRKGRVPSRRFLPRALEKDTWHEGKTLRPADNADGARDGGRDSGRGSEKPRSNFRSDAPRGEGRPFRPREDRPQGDRPREDRGDRGAPRVEGAERPARRPYEGDRPRSDRPQSDRPREDRPRGDRPWQNRSEGQDRGPRPERSAERTGGFNRDRGGERSSEAGGERRERPAPVSRNGERPQGERRNWRDRAAPQGGERGGDRGTDRGGDRGERRGGGFGGPRSDRPRGDRPQGDRPQGDRPRAARPWGDKPRGDRPQGDRPLSDRPRGDKPWADKPRGDRPQGDRPRGDRPQGDRPQGDRPRGDRPAWQSKGPRRDGDAPRADGPRGDGPRGEARGPRRDFGKSAAGGGGDRFRSREGDRAREGFQARKPRPDRDGPATAKKESPDQ